MITVDAYCERCGSELNIYQTWEGSDFRVEICDCCKEVERRLSIAVDFIRDLIINDGTHADISILAERTLKKLEEK